MVILGTGKSYLINTLADALVHDYEAENEPSPVVLAAPTGLAAYAIGGSTLHHLCKLPVQHGSIAGYKKLQRDEQQQLKRMLGPFRLLIIDEISMVTHFEANLCSCDAI